MSCNSAPRKNQLMVLMFTPLSVAFEPHLNLHCEDFDETREKPIIT